MTEARLQPIYDIAELCVRQGVNQVVLCPGSRCAPLTLAFARHRDCRVRTFSDERSAGFVGLGLAQQTQMPVALVCTSGTAAYNFSAAVAEAFFQQIPLIVFTADRPKEWIDQKDGQTIRQQNLFGNHVKKSYSLPEDYQHPDAVWFIQRTINEAILHAQCYPNGPVHINVPLREPLYPNPKEKITYSKTIKVIHQSDASPELLNTDGYGERLDSFSRILIVAGQHNADDELRKAIEKFTAAHPSAVVGELLSNLHGSEEVIRLADTFLGACDADVKKSLQPDLLITFGLSIVSKNVKLFLRGLKPQEHWHIQPGGEVSDTFQTLTEVISTSPTIFFKRLGSLAAKQTFDRQKKENFQRIWQAEEHRTQRTLSDFFELAPLSEVKVVHEFLQRLPARCNLHLANSMSVRYANLIGLEAKKRGIHVFSNRGTSGIDGCTSTAVGHSLSNETPNFLITGDLAFFYDRNAFWHNYPLPNLHVLLLNNHGGIIFNMIDGPGDVAERDEFFVTHQKLSAKFLCAEFGFDYQLLDSERKTDNLLKQFLEFDGKTKILELETTQDENKKVYLDLKQKLKDSYATTIRLAGN